MTSTTDATGHPDVAEISDLTEGLLPPARTEEVRQHLDECELCTDVHASLEEIRGLLGDLPDPPLMPADVAGRIDAALAAEALLDATASVTHVSRETSPREMSSSGDRPAGRPSASAGPGRKDRGRGRGRRRRTIALGAVLTAAVLGAGSFFLQSLGGGDGTTTAQSKPTDSAGTFSKDTLQGQVKDLLGTKTNTQRGSQKPFGVESQDTGRPSSTQSPTIKLAPTTQVPVCVRQGISQTDLALGAKKGKYEGKDAYLVVLPDTSDASKVTAYVVDASCDSTGSASPGKVFLTESLTRP
ncbi:anti-sigma factor family protein [Streptomyces sp. NPDC007901]|uniref:anti-sigma factor family protein n=1 Tax=Streptomyces sp. NPDC007901 TaxID=3364785 RepID=UPI0036EDC8EA